MSEKKVCSECSKKIPWENEGDKYYSTGLKKSQDIDNCISCWELKKMITKKF
jgi:hypothetical protein